jgi:hypothetical protein
MLWALRKRGLLNKVKDALHKASFDRSIKYNIVVQLLERCLILDRDAILARCDKIDFNPLIDIPLMLHILDNFWIMDLFPKHKKLIKKILS